MKKKGVTLQLLWYEYKQNNPDGYQFSYFCELYRKWAKKLYIALRQKHNAGEKLFIDYAGHTVPVRDPGTGKITDARVFRRLIALMCNRDMDNTKILHFENR